MRTPTTEGPGPVPASAARPGSAVWVGVNFWSSVGGPRMWARYDGATVREELAVLADLGLNITRSFCYWPDFMPAPEVLDDEVLERFSEFLDLHSEAGLSTVPTFIVGHMSGENWDPAWRGGRDLYRDVWMVSQQAWFVAEVARRFGRHPAVAGWLLSNEMPLYGGPAETEAVTAWARILIQALRSAGATQPVGTGDGAWGIETTGRDSGFSLRRLAPLVDFIGPHTYQSSDDPVRQNLAAAFACELSASFGKPVVLEEFGLSSDMASGANAAHYYRQVLYSSLLAGAQGWLAWNNCDFDALAGQDPYRHHPFEMHFGITDHARRPKPQALELSRFSRLVHRLSAGGWQRVGGEVAIVVPEQFERAEPQWSNPYRGDIRGNLFQSYIACREADLPVSLLREIEMVKAARSGPGTDLAADPEAELDGYSGEASSLGRAPGPKLLLLPCAKLITAPGLQAALGLARQGALVYASYFAGTGHDQIGPWLPWLGQVFGVSTELRYGLVDAIEGPTVTLEMVRDFGSLDDATRFTFEVGGPAPGRSFLPVVPAGAEVLAVDELDRPALLCNRAGDGWMVLCTYPLEYLAACLPGANPEPTWQLYSGLADAAGVSRPVRAPDPRVCIGGLDVGAGDAPRDRVYIAMNLSDDVVAAEVRAPGLALRLVRTTAPAPVSPGGGPDGEATDAWEGSEAEDELVAAQQLEASPSMEDLDDIARIGGEPNPYAGPSPAAVVADELGNELLEFQPYQVVVLQAFPRQGPDGTVDEDAVDEDAGQEEDDGG